MALLHCHWFPMYMNEDNPVNPIGQTAAKLPKTTDRQATVARMFHTAQA